LKARAHSEKMTPLEEIRALAVKHNVTYRQTPLDVWAQDVSRVLGDDVELDEAAQLLLALQRAGHLTGREANQIHAEYLRAKYHDRS
jgi:hypothetical protein